MNDDELVNAIEKYNRVHPAPDAEIGTLRFNANALEIWTKEAWQTISGEKRFGR